MDRIDPTLALGGFACAALSCLFVASTVILVIILVRRTRRQPPPPADGA